MNSFSLFAAALCTSPKWSYSRIMTASSLRSGQILTKRPEKFDFQEKMKEEFSYTVGKIVYKMSH